MRLFDKRPEACTARSEQTLKPPNTKSDPKPNLSHREVRPAEEIGQRLCVSGLHGLRVKDLGFRV